ncbi:hypothetical protein MJG53_008788 [Ovis ammon polii x Ovis aries]|uniref:Uncharacterized protein n=1 Tax=Ovis ammon polii x Ovis aries TaxID=2918886 RepID=A0ACB9UXL2_9CETA|nr:hypothetical protein MJT46_008417 [Ovis ammon polii x Ovis aries]KAI4582237.1 hypothetical protein MJG53_008788 [Ovis ammon polii x Ovis aries]
MNPTTFPNCGLTGPNVFDLEDMLGKPTCHFKKQIYNPFNIHQIYFEVVDAVKAAGAGLVPASATSLNLRVTRQPPVHRKCTNSFFQVLALVSMLCSFAQWINRPIRCLSSYFILHLCKVPQLLIRKLDECTYGVFLQAMQIVNRKGAMVNEFGKILAWMLKGITNPIYAKNGWLEGLEEVQDKEKLNDFQDRAPYHCSLSNLRNARELMRTGYQLSPDSSFCCECNNPLSNMGPEALF